MQYVNLFPEFETSEVQTFEMIDVSPHIESMISNPVSYETKHLIPCWSFSTPDLNITPTENCNTPRRYRNRQFIHTTRIILDYDSIEDKNIFPKIKEYEEKFNKYNFHLYTSYNHLIKQDQEKFRIILELSEPLTDEDMKVISNKSYFHEFRPWFGDIDITSFQLTRIQGIPARNILAPENYYSNTHFTGVKFDVEESGLRYKINICKYDMKLKQEEELDIRVSKSSNQGVKSNKGAEIYARKELSKMGTSDRHSTKLRICGFLRHTGQFSNDEIFDIIKDYCDSQSIQKWQQIIYQR